MLSLRPPAGFMSALEEACAAAGLRLPGEPRALIFCTETSAAADRCTFHVDACNLEP